MSQQYNNSGNTGLAAVAHIAALVATTCMLNWLIPILILAMAGNDDFVRRHAKESLNFQISLILWAIIWFLGFLFVGGGAFIGAAAGGGAGVAVGGLGIVVMFLAFFALSIVAIVCPIIGTIRALTGSDYRYPLTVRLL